MIDPVNNNLSLTNDEMVVLRDILKKVAYDIPEWRMQYNHDVFSCLFDKLFDEILEL